MPIQKYFKWLAVICGGIALSGCTAHQPLDNLDGGVVYSEPLPFYYKSPQDIVYYDEAYAYGDPFYYTPSRFHRSSVFFHSYGSKRHDRRGKKHFVDHHDEKPEHRVKSGNKTKKPKERAVRRAERKAVREAKCHDAGFRNCRAKKRAERKAKTDDSSNVVDSGNRNKDERRATRRAQCQAEGFHNCRAKTRAEKRSVEKSQSVPKQAANKRKRVKKSKKKSK